MTGLDCLREELLSRGYSKQQTESKVVAGVLDILTNAGGSYENMDHCERDLDNLRLNIALERGVLNDLKNQSSDLRKEVNELIAQKHKLIDAKIESVRNYISEFEKAISECETQEGRDRLKAAQMFINSIEVETSYDNTAYINGLASILSGGSASVEKLQRLKGTDFNQKQAFSRL